MERICYGRGTLCFSKKAYGNLSMCVHRQRYFTYKDTVKGIMEDPIREVMSSVLY